MRKPSHIALAVLFACSGVLGCGGSQPPPSTAGEAETPAPEAEPAPSDEAPARPELTAEACEANNGTVVGDIGDGAIHRADYRCPSGAAPTGAIRAPEGGPVAVEGSVCCPK